MPLDCTVAPVKYDSEKVAANRRLKNELDEAARLKSAFLRNISHEIRAPLNTIIGHAELLMEAASSGNRDQEIFRAAQAITEASCRLERSFRAILDLSKLDAVNFALAPVTVGLGQLIELQLLNVQPEAERRGIKLAFEIEDPQITVVIDEYCLAHAMANLLDNAIKFTERGHITVKAYRDVDGRICVGVEDTGIGIDPSYLPRMFEPFSQEDSREARRYQGMGLGLALAKRYLALNCAELSAASKKNDGTVFTIRFAKVF